MRPLLLLIALSFMQTVALGEMKRQIVQFEDGTSYSLSGDCFSKVGCAMAANHSNGRMVIGVCQHSFCALTSLTDPEADIIVIELPPELMTADD
ncbi:MAG: hypothetical protein ACN4GR_14525 [Arenicellales bacterium]